MAASGRFKPPMPTVDLERSRVAFGEPQRSEEGLHCITSPFPWPRRGRIGSKHHSGQSGTNGENEAAEEIGCSKLVGKFGAQRTVSTTGWAKTGSRSDTTGGSASSASGFTDRSAISPVLSHGSKATICEALTAVTDDPHPSRLTRRSSRAWLAATDQAALNKAKERFQRVDTFLEPSEQGNSISSCQRRVFEEVEESFLTFPGWAKRAKASLSFKNKEGLLTRAWEYARIYNPNIPSDQKSTIELSPGIGLTFLWTQDEETGLPKDSDYVFALVTKDDIIVNESGLWFSITQKPIDSLTE